MLTLKSDVTANDPAGIMQFLENDFAIIRGVTTGLIDFSNKLIFNNVDFSSVTIPSGTAIDGLTFGAASGNVQQGDIIGGISVNNTITMQDAGHITLPLSDFKTPNDGSTTRAVQIFWVNISTGGYPDGGNATIMIAGDNTTFSDNYGFFALNYQSNTPSAQITTLSSNNQRITASWSNDTALEIAGALCQVAISTEEIDASNGVAKIYKNGILLETIQVALDLSATETGGSNYKLGSESVFQDISGQVEYGRVNIADLTSRPDLSAEDYILRDFNHARSFFGV